MKTKIIVALVVALGLVSYSFYKNQSTSAPIIVVLPDTKTGAGNGMMGGTAGSGAGAGGMMGNSPMVNNRKYKDGTYTAVGNYRAPSGNEYIDVTLTISNDKVTSASVDSPSGNRTARRFQDNFSSGFQGYVVGKSVDSISLSVVSGASLTPRGFMSALSDIQSQAKA